MESQLVTILKWTFMNLMLKLLIPRVIVFCRQPCGDNCCRRQDFLINLPDLVIACSEGNCGVYFSFTDILFSFDHPWNVINGISLLLIYWVKNSIATLYMQEELSTQYFLNVWSQIPLTWSLANEPWTICCCSLYRKWIFRK